jgi:DNA repair protein RecO (recombination protein O)
LRKSCHFKHQKSFPRTEPAIPNDRITIRIGEAIILRTWPFHEADLLVSLFTREHGRLKGVARHAMRSRRRFGGALEPMTHVIATWAERPRQELVRLDAFEILTSPMIAPVDFARVAAIELIAEVLDELPEGAVEDAVFRLALAVQAELHVDRVWMPVTYFCLWMNRLMGWMPELGTCVVCGNRLLSAAWYSPSHDGLTCHDDRRPASIALPATALAEASRMFRSTVAGVAAEPWPRTRTPELRRFAIETLERHLERRLVSARSLERA